MKFNPGRDNSPFMYKGYEAWIRRSDNCYLTYDTIEIRLVKRNYEDSSKTMIIRFLIKNRSKLFYCLHKAVAALKKAENGEIDVRKQTDIWEEST